MIQPTKTKSGFYIGVGCPGCGGEVRLDDDFFVTTCKFCGSNLRVLLPDTPVAYLIRSGIPEMQVRFYLDRYLKTNNQPLSGSSLMTKKLYYPYWKCDATLLKLRNRMEKTSYLTYYNGACEEHVATNPRSKISITPYSVTVAAGSPMPSVPDSLGMRSETIKIVPFMQDNVEDDFDALPIVRPWETVQQKINLALATVENINEPEFGANITWLFNPVFSLLYFPYILAETYTPTYQRYALDGLTGRVLGSADTSEKEESTPPERATTISVNLGKIGVSIGLTPPSHEHASFVDNALADGTVEDLSSLDIDTDTPSDTPQEITFGELKIGFHRCTNCGADLPARQSYVYICDNCHCLQVLDKSDYRLPQIELADSSDNRSSKFVPFWLLRFQPEQTARFATLLGILDPTDYLAIPALRSGNFEAVHRLAKRMTAAKSQLQTHAVEVMDERFMPVQVSLAEATARATMIVARECLKLGNDVDFNGFDLTPVEVGLFYVPFRLENYFYVDSVLNAVTVEKTLLE